MRERGEGGMEREKEREFMSPRASCHNFTFLSRI